jgi:hypothetical protein
LRRGADLHLCRIEAFVLPPITGGLHCGVEQVNPRAFNESVFPPVSGGLHCGYCCAPGTGLMVTHTPAGQRRAPLRKEALRLTNTGASVLPLFRSGLHCGSQYRFVASWNGLYVLPPDNRRASLRLDDH